jgi:hypothetical protein
MTGPGHFAMPIFAMPIFAMPIFAMSIFTMPCGGVLGVLAPTPAPERDARDMTSR